MGDCGAFCLLCLVAHRLFRNRWPQLRTRVTSDSGPSSMLGSPAMQRAPSFLLPCLIRRSQPQRVSQWENEKENRFQLSPLILKENIRSLFGQS